MNGKSVDQIDGISTYRMSKRISNLGIDSVQNYHTGNYTCSASNAAGATNYTTFLAVNGNFSFLVVKKVVVTIFL